MNAKNPKFAIAQKGEFSGNIVSGQKYPIINVEDTKTQYGRMFTIISPSTGSDLL